MSAGGAFAVRRSCAAAIIVFGFLVRRKLALEIFIGWSRARRRLPVPSRRGPTPRIAVVRLCPFACAGSASSSSAPPLAPPLDSPSRWLAQAVSVFSCAVPLLVFQFDRRLRLLRRRVLVRLVFVVLLCGSHRRTPTSSVAGSSCRGAGWGWCLGLFVCCAFIRWTRSFAGRASLTCRFLRSCFSSE